MSVQDLRVRPGRKVHLGRWDPADTSTFDGKKDDSSEALEKLRVELDRLQELLYANHRNSVLIVLQGMDAAGKDGVIRHVFEGVNPQGVHVASFKVPTVDEGSHDFLWRVHPWTPARGHIAIFNRSHYEDVLAARVHALVPEEVWEKRYRSINEFERTLANEGTTVLKFFLHVSKAEQRRRLQDRLDDPTKHWKFSESDVHERKLWPQYMAAFQELLERTSTAWAPWYIVPSDHKWFRNWVVSKVLVGTLGTLRLRPPKGPKDLRSIRIS